MKISIIGAGNVGTALGTGWRDQGHDVTYALRGDSDSARKVARDGFPVVPLADAGNTDVVVLAVPFDAAAGALKDAGGLEGKIVVDATNPLTKTLDLAFGFSESAGERIAALAPKAKIVKAFNTTGAENMARGREFAVSPMMPIAGDDAEAKKTVAKLAQDLGFEPVDAGPLSAARLLEPMALFWIKQAMAMNRGQDFAFALTTR